MKAPGYNDYRIVISRSQHRPRADIYLFGVRDLIPALPDSPPPPGETEPTLPSITSCTSCTTRVGTI